MTLNDIQASISHVSGIYCKLLRVLRHWCSISVILAPHTCYNFWLIYLVSTASKVKLSHSISSFCQYFLYNQLTGLDFVRGIILPLSYLWPIAVNTVLALPQSLWYLVSENKWSPCCNSTSSLEIDLFVVISMLFCISLPHFIEMGPSAVEF